MTIIDGKQIANKIKTEIATEVFKIKDRPNLAIILIGDRQDSKLYVDIKEKEAKLVGIDTHIYKCSKNISEKEVIEMINFLNKDDNIDGILIQLPLPSNLDTDKIIKTIDSKKDIDGFHPDNIKKISNKNKILPPVFSVVLTVLNEIKCDLKNKNVCIVGNSDVFTKNLDKLLIELGATVNITNIKDKNLNDKTSTADILITAVGKPQFINKDMIKKDVIIIDIGITKTIDGKVYGDVDFEDVKDKAGYLTPVPGGVGPMTIALAFKNTLELYKERHDSK